MEAALIAQHRAPALFAALFALVVATLVGCHGGVDVAVVGIPADSTVTVSVDSLSQEIASSPSKVYRYRGIGYARVLGLLPAPSYTATARRMDGCAVAVGSAEYDGSDEVRIDLHAVDNCDKPAPMPTPVTPQPIAPSPMPQPMPQPQPVDSDKDGVPDAQDLCPLLAGSQANSRPGCPLPKTVAATLVPMLRGGVQTASGYDFTVSTSPQYLDYLIILPTEAATARQVRVDYSIAATAKWAAPSGWCASQGLANRHQLGPGTPGSTTYCLAYGYRAGLSSMTMQPGEFIVESPRPAGDAPTQIKATTTQGQIGVVDARTQNTLRLMLSGTVSVSEIATSASVTMEW